MLDTFIFLGLGWQAWTVISLTIAVFTLALTTKLPTYAIFMGAITVLMVLGILDTKVAIEGFSNSAVVTAGVLFVLVAGLERAGVMHWLVAHLLKTPKNHTQGILSMMLPSAFMSSFLSNTSVVALLINVVRIWCKNSKFSPSQLLIPLSYASGAGGALTLIGSPSTLIIADLYAKKSGTTLNLFAPFIPALICFIVCLLSVILMRKLLPNRKEVEEDQFEMQDKALVIKIPSDEYSMVGKTIKECSLGNFGGAKLVKQVHFDGETNSPIDEEEPIMGGDRLYFQGEITSLEPEEKPSSKKTICAAFGLLLMLVLSLTGVLDLLTACLVSAFAMIAMKCMTIKEGYNGINWQVIIVWASSIALGKAFEVTGVAQALANGIVGISGTHPLAILFAICLIGTFLTEFVSNTAAAALLFPIVASTVEPLGLPILPFTLALMVSVTCSFATPIGSPTHMLIYSPGNYRFTDFMRIGLPMNLIVLAANVLSVYFIFFV